MGTVEGGEGAVLTYARSPLIALPKRGAETRPSELGDIVDTLFVDVRWNNVGGAAKTGAGARGGGAEPTAEGGNGGVEPSTLCNALRLSRASKPTASNGVDLEMLSNSARALRGVALIEECKGAEEKGLAAVGIMGDKSLGWVDTGRSGEAENCCCGRCGALS